MVSVNVRYKTDPYFGELVGYYIRILLLSVPIVMSWLFAGVDAWVRLAAFSLLIGAAGLWALATFYQRVLPRVTVAIWLCGAALCLAAMQCLQLPQAVVGFLSPQAVELRGLLLDTQTATTTITQSLTSTRQSTAMLIMAIIVLFLTSQLMRRSGSLDALLWVFAANGALLASIGIIQKLYWPGEGFWPVPTGFASFINKNNAAGFLNIALATALGLLVSVWQRPTKSSSTQSLLMRQPGLNWSPDASSPPRLDAINAVAIVLVVVIAGGVISTASRGGIISAVGGLAAVTVAVWRKRRSLMGIAFLIVVLAAIGLAEMADQFYLAADRVAGLTEERTYANDFNGGRLGHWQDMYPAIPDFWLTGSGLGTYGDVNHMYQRSSSGEGWFRHAENQYLEAVIEAGVIGLGLMLGCIVVVCRAVSRLMQPRTHSLPIAVCGCFAITSQAIHAMFDFGLYIPANACAFAIVCGAVIGRADYLHRKSIDHTEGPNAWRARVEQVSVIGTMLTVALITLLEFRYEQLSERVQYDSAATMFDWGTPLTLQERWSTAHELLADRPDDAELQLFTTQLHIDRYRVLAAQQLRDELGESVKDDELEAATSLTFLHRRVAELKQGPDAELGIQLLRDQAVIRENLVPAREHLLVARQASPLSFYVHLDLAALAFLEAQTDDRRHMERAKLILPTHPDLLYWAGFLEQMDGRPAQAYDDWKQCLRFSAKHDKSILDMGHAALPLAEVIRQIVPDDPKVLLRLAETYYNNGQRKTERERVLDQASRSIEDGDLPEWKKHHFLALVDRQRGQMESADEHYRNAVKRSPRKSQQLYDEYGQFLHELKNLKNTNRPQVLP
jgi:O-antigen ligase/tetratricopeptide (TPR) repeat protein